MFKNKKKNTFKQLVSIFSDPNFSRKKFNMSLRHLCVLFWGLAIPGIISSSGPPAATCVLGGRSCSFRAREEEKNSWIQYYSTWRCRFCVLVLMQVFPAELPQLPPFCSPSAAAAGTTQNLPEHRSTAMFWYFFCFFFPPSLLQMFNTDPENKLWSREPGSKL